MAKRPAAGAAEGGAASDEEDGARPAGSPEEACGGTKRAKLYTSDEVEALIQKRISSLGYGSNPKSTPPLLQEVFTPNDPVHGLMHLPLIVKVVVDTVDFQRMRHIRQLGAVSYVYPGATHNRFIHSLGTAFLAYELMKYVKHWQPELGTTNRDVLCVMLAGLCHDLGHPCFSHMFERFVHMLAAERRQRAEAAAKAEGLDRIPESEEADLRTYEGWNHEQASLMLLRKVFADLAGPLAEAGLRVDAEGDDFECIRELIDPPKKGLEGLMKRKQLREGWSGLIKGRPVEKAWLYEIVSNWRSGIDVDKFDYFRRDTHGLGIPWQCDHDRYLKGVRVIQDSEGVYTISPPEKDKDLLRESMLELRKMLHRTAYQHRTVKKMELHMIDILIMMDEHVRVQGVGGKELRMSEAAVRMDPVAYPKLTDTFIEGRLLVQDDPALAPAFDEYERRMVRRELMRLVGEWELPRESEGGGIALPDERKLIEDVHGMYRSVAAELQPEKPVREVAKSDLRCEVVKLHYGMGSQDPITRILFHNHKSNARRTFVSDMEAKPLREKIFLFWNPAQGRDDELTIRRLTRAFTRWAEDQLDRKASPEVSPEAPPAPPAREPPRRVLRIMSSCPNDMDP